MPIKEILIDKISKTGSIGLDEYMSLCLCHPEFGYYMKKDPFGSRGDFTTAPEISQMFGEMIGIWCADLWQKMGRPSAFNLVEFGPGRGSLMKDLLRATANVKNFNENVSVKMLEISPVLKELQKKSLQGNKVKINWYENLGFLKEINNPTIIIANEFFDALPIKQFIKTGSGWVERKISHDGRNFIFVTGDKDYKNIIPSEFFDAKTGSIFEYSPQSKEIIEIISSLLKEISGGILIIDYGYLKPFIGDSLQAIKAHKYSDVLKDPGEADITSHVNFHEIKKIFASKGLDLIETKTQAEFLKEVGIEIRAEMLFNNADEKQKRDIKNSLNRLISEKEMGTLFKCFSAIDISF